MSVIGLDGANSETLTRLGSRRFEIHFSPPLFAVTASNSKRLTYRDGLVDRPPCTAMALIPIAIAALVAYQTISYALRLRFHINEAKRSGLPYIVLRASTYIRSPASLHGPL